MRFLFNELSVHGQFPNLQIFYQSAGQIMVFRKLIENSGHRLYCHQNLLNAQVTRDCNLQQAAWRWPNRDQKIAWLSWITKHGPYWMTEREHPEDVFLELELNDDLVTDSAVGEAAYRCFLRLDCDLVSATPSSSWNINTVRVRVKGDEETIVSVPNVWTRESLEEQLKRAQPDLHSWLDLENFARSNFNSLTFSDDAFRPLQNQPYSPSASDRIRSLLSILHQLRGGFGENGQFTQRARDLHQLHFHGDKAWFSDSSDSEKRQFPSDLTFRNPQNADTLFCPWHGKVKSPQYRVHFSYPITHNAPLFVVYLGPKITKR